MKPRERFLKAAKKEEPDRVPQLIRWAKDIGIKLSSIFGASGTELGIRIDNDVILCQIGLNAHMEMSAGDLKAGETVTSEWGVVYQRQSGFNNPIKFPLNTREDLKNYTYPDPHAPFRMDEIKEVMRNTAKKMLQDIVGLAANRPGRLLARWGRCVSPL